MSTRFAAETPMSGTDLTPTLFEEQLAGLFTIDIEFRSEMRNHLHVVLRPCPGAAKRLSAVEVARRWLTIRKLAKCMTDELPVPDERRVQALAKDKKRIKTPRKQPGSISWFMAILSENIARRANREDACRGRFWCLKVRGKSRTENLWDPVPSPENAKGG
ncbi:MAG: hypothetical protein ACQESR_16340 [Planctomycetota bacterium]